MLFILVPFLFALLPLSQAKVHRLKLKKLPPAASSPDLEALYLAEKYGLPQQQKPMMAASRINRPASNQDGEPLFYTQEELKGGHRVPLSSTVVFLALRTSRVTASLDFMNAQYFSEITLGTPPQSVRLGHIISSFPLF